MVSKLLLLLFCLIKYNDTTPVGNTPRPVTGKKGENATLSCESEARDISDIVLNRLSKKILVCQNEKCESENSRVFKEGSCDVIIKDLIYSDAGKYILHVYYTNDQTEVKPQIREYHLHIHEEISVKKGEDLKLDVLLSNAYKVEKNSSEGWKKIWTRGHRISSDRLTDRDGNLIINEFTDTDTGTYRVLDSNNKVLITVTVTESGTHSRTRTGDDPKANDTEHNIRFWTLSVGLPVLLAFCRL